MKPWIRLVVETIVVIPRVVRAIREARRREQAKEAAKVKMLEDQASTFQSSIRKAAKDIKEGR